MRSYLRLALGGLLLDRQIFREQRDAPDGVRRGALLVMLVGLAVGLAGLIGGALAPAINPAPAEAARVIAATLNEAEWFQRQPAELREVYDEAAFAQVVELIVPSPQSGLLGVLTTPLLLLLGWLIYSVPAHLLARLMGGEARLGQTLAATAVASGAQLLNLTQAVPTMFVAALLDQNAVSQALLQSSAALILGLMGSYLAIRETHTITPWQAFWAVTLVPLALGLLLLCGACAILLLFAGLAGA